MFLPFYLVGLAGKQDGAEGGVSMAYIVSYLHVRVTLGNKMPTRFIYAVFERVV